MNSEKVKNLVREMGPLIGLIVLFIVIAALNDSFIDPSNLKNLARQISINALIAFGMTFVILTGGIDLSVGAHGEHDRQRDESGARDPFLCFHRYPARRCEWCHHFLRKGRSFHCNARYNDHLSRRDARLYEW